MNLEDNYFYITMNFNYKVSPPEMEKIDNNILREAKSGVLYKRRPLYDFGWGQEHGLEKLPPLRFDELIELVIKFNNNDEILIRLVKFSNMIGAVAVIMEDHVLELIDFLTKKILTDFFEDKQIRENFKWFCFDEKVIYSRGGIKTLSYEEVLKKYPQWNKISSNIKEKVYGN